MTSESKWTGVRSQIWFPSGSSEAPCIQEVLVGLTLPNIDQTIWFGWFRGWRPYIDTGGASCPFAQDYYTTVQLWAKIDGARGNPCVLLTPSGMSRGAYHNVQIVRSSTNSSVYLFKLDSTQLWSWNFGSAQSGYAFFAAAFRFYDSATEPTTSDAGRWNNIQGKVGSNAWQKPLPALSWADHDNVSGHNYVAQNLADGTSYLNECTHLSGGSCPGA